MEESTPISENSLPPVVETPQSVAPEVAKIDSSPKSKKKGLTILLISIFLVLITAGIASAVWLSSRKDKAEEETAIDDTLPEEEEELENEEELDAEALDLEEDASTGSATEEATPPAEEPEDLPSDDEPEPVPAVVDEDRIVYIKDDNIWVMNNDGTGKIQITADASEMIQYRVVDWKEPGVISYSRCGGECGVYTYDLATSTEDLVFTGIPFTQSFDAIKWSHDGNSIAYIFTKGDFSKEASILTAGTTTVLQSYAPPPGRGGHYDDGMEIEFSPNDLKLVVLNTAIDETINKPVMAFETDGTMLVELESATFPTFYSNSGFYYKREGLIKRWNLLTSTSSTVTFVPTASIHDLKTSPDGYFISFWSDVSGADLQVNYYDTGGSSSTVATDYVEPRWLDDGSVYFVAIKVSDIGVMGMYESGGLSRVQRTNGSAIDLDLGAIYTFEVE